MVAETLADFARSARGRVSDGYYERRPSGRAPPAVSLAARLRAARGIIAEIKPASPTAGRLRAKVDPAALANAFAKAGAAGVSALAEPDRFGGSLENVLAAASAGVPVLFKDFVVDARQVAAARAWGASCVLIIPEALESAAAADELVEAAHAEGLEVLLEVYDEGGFARALRGKADLIGVNNRDLRREGLPVDLGRTPRVLAGAPRERPLVALSGVSSPKEARAMFEAGASGVLVGSALMRAEDPGEALRELWEGIQ